MKNHILISISISMIALLIGCNKTTKGTTEHYYLKNECYFSSTFYLNNSACNNICIPIVSDFSLDEITNVSFYEGDKEVISSSKVNSSLYETNKIAGENHYILSIDVELDKKEQKADMIKVFLKNDIIIYNVDVNFILNNEIIDPIIYSENSFENFLSLNHYEVEDGKIKTYFYLQYNKDIEFLEIENTSTDYFGYVVDANEYYNNHNCAFNELKKGIYFKWTEGPEIILHTHSCNSKAIVYFDNIILKCIVNDTEYGYIASRCDISTCSTFFDNCGSILKQS